MMESFENFIQSKSAAVKPSGFKVDPDDLHPALFPFQRANVARALYQGRFCNGCDTGLGKSLQSLAWATVLTQKFGKPVLIVAPLQVAYQFQNKEGPKFNVKVTLVKDPLDLPIDYENSGGIFVTNYENLNKFDLSGFIGFVADEGSTLKNFTGTWANQILQKSSVVPYRLSASATFSPNDLTEMGMQAEFVGVCTLEDMISEYFTMERGVIKNNKPKYRLKKYADNGPFWEWLSSWCCLVKKPSDLGDFDDSQYELPGYKYVDHKVQTLISPPEEGLLPGLWIPSNSYEDNSLIEKTSFEDRCQLAAKLANETTDQIVICCNRNPESEYITKLIPDAVEIAGKHDAEYRAKVIQAFQDKNERVIVSKDKIIGFGLNLQESCHNMIIFPNNSYEKEYQLIRRLYRYGQKKQVTIHRVYHELQSHSMIRNVKHKADLSETMFTQILPYQKRAMLDYQDKVIDNYLSIANQDMRLPIWI